MSTNWYTEVDNKEVMFQGDIVRNVNVLDPHSDLYVETDLIILNQSCDLAVPKKAPVVLCSAITTLNTYMKERHKHGVISNDYNSVSDHFESLRTNRVIQLVLLGKCNQIGFNDYLLCILTDMFLINRKELLKSYSNNSDIVRLNTPYREFLSHRVAGRFSRVALDADIKKLSQNDFTEISKFITK